MLRPMVCSRVAACLMFSCAPGLLGIAQEMPVERKVSESAPEMWSFGGQATFVLKYHPAFKSPYRGTNSFDPGSRGNETFDATLFLGVRPWSGAEIWADPEVDQGFGLSNTFGIAGFPSGEACKVGSTTPYIRIPRLFFRQAFDLGSASQKVEREPNQFGETRSSDNLVVTKFSAVDVF